MAFLGISSATNVISVGLVEKGNILSEITVADKQAFTEDLLVYIDKIVGAIHESPLRGISVVQGPGAYSGLRGGLAVAKTLAQTKELPLIGVSTLEAIAYNLIDCEGTIAVTTDARRSEYNFALFTVKDRNLQRLTDDLVLDSEKIENIFSQVNGKLIQPDAIHSYARGGVVARLGEQKFAESGISEDIFKMVPKYSHKPNLREWKK